MYRNEKSGLKSLFAAKIAGLIAVIALSGCALTGPVGMGETSTDAAFENIHHGS